MKKLRTVSHSQMGAYNSCAHRFELEYVDRLRLKKGVVQQSSLGDLVHNGIAAALREVYAIQTSKKLIADAKAQKRISKAVHSAIEARVVASRGTVIMLEDDETPIADDWNALADEALGITMNLISELDLWNRYSVMDMYQYDPNDDVETMVPLIEFSIKAPLTDDAYFSGVIDAVLHDRFTDDVVIFDWKVRKQFTDYETELLDGQLALYQHALNQLFDFEINTTVLYQIKNKAPQRPEVLKNGKAVSRAKIVSTWDIYRQAVIDAGFNPDDYEDEMRPKLAEVQFFQPIAISRSRKTTSRFWQNAVDFAVLTAEQKVFPMALGYSCRNCPFAKLCTARVMGYGLEEAMERYEVRPDDISLEEE